MYWKSMEDIYFENLSECKGVFSDCNIDSLRSTNGIPGQNVGRGSASHRRLIGFLVKIFSVFFGENNQ